MDSATIAQFVAITGASELEAQNHLVPANGDLQTAVDNYYNSISSNSESSQNQPASTSHASAPFSQPTPSSHSRPTNPPQPRKKFGSLRDLQQSDSTEGDDSDDKDQQYFAGGDKSALAVQDPSNSDRPMSTNEHVERLLHTARQNRPRPPAGGDDDEEELVPPQNNFRGAGVTLGGEGTDSRVIPDPDAVPPGAARPPPTQMVQRTLHLWDDGFSVDDGALHRYDDPRNNRTLEMINRGSAPLDIMNVETGQAVDVKLEHHRGQNYVRPAKKYRPFEGQGNRLGSPTPGVATPAFDLAPSAAPSSANAMPAVDPSQPAVRLQIRLPDGTRLPAQFNTSATVGDVQTFVRRAHPESANRSFALATTFPTKELVDAEAVVGEVSELKRGGVVVVKWV